MLPPDIIIHILGPFLHPVSIYNLIFTCKDLFHLRRNLWKTIKEPSFLPLKKRVLFHLVTHDHYLPVNLKSCILKYKLPHETNYARYNGFIVMARIVLFFRHSNELEQKMLQSITLQDRAMDRIFKVLNPLQWNKEYHSDCLIIPPINDHLCKFLWKLSGFDDSCLIVESPFVDRFRGRYHGPRDN